MLQGPALCVGILPHRLLKHLRADAHCRSGGKVAAHEESGDLAQLFCIAALHVESSMDRDTVASFMWQQPPCGPRCLRFEEGRFSLCGPLRLHPSTRSFETLFG